MKRLEGDVCTYRFTVENIDEFIVPRSSPSFDYFGVSWNLLVTSSGVMFRRTEDEFIYEGFKIMLSRFDQNEKIIPREVFYDISLVRQSKGLDPISIRSASHKFDATSEPEPGLFIHEFINNPAHNFKKNGSIVVQVKISKKALVQPPDDDSKPSPESSQIETPNTVAKLFVPKFDYVYFNVGGHLHMSHSSTLLKFPASTLAKYVKPEFDSRKAESEFIKIDRDGAQMGLILSYMRDPIQFTVTHLSPDQLKSLKKEADFYWLPELIDICDSQLTRNEPWTRTAVAITDKRIMTDTLLQCKKLSIVLHCSIEPKILRKLIQHCDESRYNVYCYYEDAWFDGQFTACLYDPDIHACVRRIITDNELILLRFIIDTHDYVRLS